MQRVTYRRRHCYNTKSNKTRVVKTPGGRNVILYRKKKGSVPRCGVSGVKLAGIKAKRPNELKRATKRTKKVSRAYGGSLSAAVVRKHILRSFLSTEQRIANRLNKSKHLKEKKKSAKK